MWERTLQDLIRGLRANKKDESKFIATAVDEIRREIKSDDMELKAAAVLKLTYLDMLGYDMSWASFHIVEVMSSPKFHLKSVGYLAAVQCFTQETDVLMLTTNLLKKDLTSTPAEISVTLNGISHIATPDLGQDLAPAMLKMLTHSQPQIRKRAVITLYKLMLKYPEIFSAGLDRLKEKLEDPDPGVLASTVNVLCEIARTNSKDLLTFAPPLFHLLTTSSNNWMLIKLIKLFGSLCPLEPRLVKKLLSPITELISTTPAISLLYECVHTCIISGMLQGPTGDSLASTCVSKLSSFIQDPDQNLKYIALLALTKIVPTHAHLVADYQDTILVSINDQDMSIRMRALDLVSAMVNQNNLQSIVQQLLGHLVSDSSSSAPPTAAQSLAQISAPASPAGSIRPPIAVSQSPSYRILLCQRILAICSENTYENVTNFEWYLSVLVDLAHVANVDVGAPIRDQLVDVVGRVKACRRFAVKLMYSLLSENTMLRNARDEGSCSEVLWAAAWICGEHCSELAEPQKLLTYLLQPDITTLSADIIAVHIQAAAKIFGYWAASVAERWTDDDLPEIKSLVEEVISRVSDFVASPHIEVQERAANTLELFNFIQTDLNAWHPKSDNPFADDGADTDPAAEPRFPKSLYLIQPLFSSYTLNPVAIYAQESVPIPEGLDLDSWIIPPLPEPTELIEKTKKTSKKGKAKEVNGVKSTKSSKKKQKQLEYEYDEDDYEVAEAGPSTVAMEEEQQEEDPEDRARRKAERLERLKDDPYYLIDDKPKQQNLIDHDVDSIPVVRLADMPSLDSSISSTPILRETPYAQASEPFYIEKDGEMPEGALLPSSNPISRHSTPDVVSPTPSSRISTFAEYEIPGEGSTPSTPPPVQVVKKKKKGTGTKKRTQT